MGQPLSRHSDAFNIGMQPLKDAASALGHSSGILSHRLRKQHRLACTQIFSILF